MLSLSFLVTYCLCQSANAGFELLAELLYQDASFAARSVAAVCGSLELAEALLGRSGG